MKKRKAEEKREGEGEKEKGENRWDSCVNGRVLYEWIKGARFSVDSIKFEPSLRVGYLLTGHGSLNAFLFSRNLSGTAACPSGFEREDWVHVLCECDMYAAFRNVDAMGVVRRGNEWDVSQVLGVKEYYEELCRYAERAFKMRKSMLERMARDAGE